MIDDSSDVIEDQCQHIPQAADAPDADSPPSKRLKTSHNNDNNVGNVTCDENSSILFTIQKILQRSIIDAVLVPHVLVDDQHNSKPSPNSESIIESVAQIIIDVSPLLNERETFDSPSTPSNPGESSLNLVVESGAQITATLPSLNELLQTTDTPSTPSNSGELAQSADALPLLNELRTIDTYSVSTNPVESTPNSESVFDSGAQITDASPLLNELQSIDAPSTSSNPDESADIADASPLISEPQTIVALPNQSNPVESESIDIKEIACVAGSSPDAQGAEPIQTTESNCHESTQQSKAISRKQLIQQARDQAKQNMHQWSSMITAGLNKRLMKEKAELDAMPISNCSAAPKSDSSLIEWEAVIIGPEGTPYHGGVFFCDISFPDNYPFAPPKVVFRTKIYHCNINSVGAVCLDLLRDAWCPSLTISKVLLSLLSLLASPNPDDPLVKSIALVLQRSPEEYNRNAFEWTKKYAL